jgi:hypothetical protein
VGREGEGRERGRGWSLASWPSSLGPPCGSPRTPRRCLSPSPVFASSLPREPGGTATNFGERGGAGEARLGGPAERPRGEVGGPPVVAVGGRTGI